MSTREMVAWSAFESDFGPLTLHERIDHAAALIAFTVWKAAGQKGRLEDFLPQWRAEEELDAPDFFRALG